MTTVSAKLEGIDAEGLKNLAETNKTYPSKGRKVLTTVTRCEAGFRNITSVRDTADNVRSGQSAMIEWDRLDDDPAVTVIDVRDPSECAGCMIPGSVNIPLNELRARAAEIPVGPVVVTCQVGLRGHVAERILRQMGFGDVRNLSGGYRTWSDGMEAAFRRADSISQASAAG